MLINMSKRRRANGGGGPLLPTFTVTIPSAKVGSTLTNFPVMVDLEQIDPASKAAFWAAVNTDGGNIRAYSNAGGTEYPLDIAVIQKRGQTGTLWVKVPSITNGGGASFILQLGALSQQRAARNATYGSAAVWSDYQSVFLGGENTDDHASTSRLFSTEGDNVSFLNVGNPEMTFANDPHQGGTWHEASGEVYTVDNNALRRYDASGTLLTSNTDPNGDIMAATGMTGLIHLCDICVVGDWLIVPANDYPSTTKCAIAVYDRTTLTLVAATDVSATETKISGICWNDDLQQLVTCNWGSFTSMFKFDLNLSTGAVTANGTIPLNRLNSTPNLNNAAQGIEWWRGHYWIPDDNRDEVVRVKPNGDYHSDNSPIQFRDNNSTSVAGNYEGIFKYKDGLAVLIDPTSANSYLIYSTPCDFDFGGGGGRWGANGGYFETVGLTGGTTFTISVSAARSSAAQYALASFRDFSAGGTNDRVTLLHRNVSSVYTIQMWDDINLWLTPGAPVTPANGVWNRVAGVYNGTNRELFIDGVSKASQAGITARDAGFTALSIGNEDPTGSDNFNGDIAFAYLRMQAMSADWLAAEHSMVSNPSGFYTIAMS